MKVRHNLKLHIKRADEVARLRKPRKERKRNIMEQATNRIDPEVIKVARGLAGDDPGRMQVSLGDKSITVWNNREQKRLMAHRKEES
jgi:hypothetical protein